MIPKVTQQTPNIIEHYWCTKCGRHLWRDKSLFDADGYLYCPGCGEFIEWDKVEHVKWKPMSCDICGKKMIVELGGHMISTGEYVGGSTCRVCMEEYCNSTNCLTCQVGTYPECKFMYLKRKPEEAEE